MKDYIILSTVVTLFSLIALWSVNQDTVKVKRYIEIKCDSACNDSIVCLKEVI